MTTPPSVFDVVVVGGGMAGLVLARDAAKGGLSVALLEASDRLGGEVMRHTVAGIDLDAGAESFATRGGTVATLATQLGLGNDLVTPDARGAWILEADGSAVKIPKTGLLGIPGVPLAADVIAVVGASGAFRAQMDSLLPGTLGAKEQKLGPLIRRRMGAAVLDRLVTPVVMGVHSAHPDDLDVDRVAPGLRKALLREGSLSRGVRDLRSMASAGSAVGGITGGIVRLVDELTADLDAFHVDVRRSSRVRSFDASSVTLDGGERLSARNVVLAVGGSAAARLRGRDETPGTITLATLVVRAPELDAAPRGTGVLVAPGAPGIRAKALTHASIKWPWIAERADGRHVLRLSYDSPAVVHETSEDDLRGVALADASSILGVALVPSALDGFGRIEWEAPLRSTVTSPVATGSATDDDGIVRVGGVIAGRGLAAVVADARAKAALLVAR